MAVVFVAEFLFILNLLGGTLKILNFITRLYGIVLEVNYLFHTEFARNYLISKMFHPPSGDLLVPPPLKTFFLNILNYHTS